MPNGECAKGASNEQRIKALENGNIRQDKRTERIEGKIDWMFYLIIATLVSTVVNLITAYNGG